jgi:NADPH:quinone reductase-like Zn-dependent oxidoreductase
MQRYAPSTYYKNYAHPNFQDLYVLGGKVDTKDVTCSCECAGIVTAVGEDVQDLEVGDRVVCMAPGHFGTFERVPHWAVTRLRRNETFVVSLGSTTARVEAHNLIGNVHRANRICNGYIRTSAKS